MTPAPDPVPVPETQASSPPAAAPCSDAAVRHSSRLELSQSAMRNNLEFVRDQVGPHPRISMVVKANAYGHGIAPAVTMARRCGIDHFSVASGYEAQEVLAAAPGGVAVMVMGILYDEDLPWAIGNDVEFFVFDESRVRRAAEVAGRLGKPARIHVEVETGGNRTGLSPEQLPDVLRIVRANRSRLLLRGICTHLAGSETLANRFRTVRQVERFERVRDKLHRQATRPEIFHMACSAAALSMRDAAYDLVRIGVAAYGLWPSPDIFNLHLVRTVDGRQENPLQRVLTWKTDVMHLKRVRQDEFVGYGTAYQAPRDMTIAVIPIGYSNGYPREMSNRGHVLIRGKRARVVGLVNMNVFTVDVSNILDVQVGDEVVLVGRQRNNVITLRSFSEFAHALNTEFVCRLPASIPRTIVR
jgi:alanine racemase